MSIDNGARERAERAIIEYAMDHPEDCVYTLFAPDGTPHKISLKDLQERERVRCGSMFDPEALTRCVIRDDCLIVVDDRGTLVRFSEILAAWRAQQEKKEQQT
jgi:hypothetical protein